MPVAVRLAGLAAPGVAERRHPAVFIRIPPVGWKPYSIDLATEVRALTSRTAGVVCFATFALIYVGLVLAGLFAR